VQLGRLVATQRAGQSATASALRSVSGFPKGEGTDTTWLLYPPQKQVRNLPV